MSTHKVSVKKGLTVKKQGKKNKTRYHKRFIQVKLGKLLVYKNKLAFKNKKGPKYNIDLSNKTCKAYQRTATSMQSKTNCGSCAPSCSAEKVHSFFVKLIDLIDKTTDMVFKVKDKIEAQKLRRAIRRA